MGTAKKTTTGTNSLVGHDDLVSPQRRTSSEKSPTAIVAIKIASRSPMCIATWPCFAAASKLASYRLDAEPTPAVPSH
jgi:hypothetical protein